MSQNSPTCDSTKRCQTYWKVADRFAFSTLDHRIPVSLHAGKSWVLPSHFPVLTNLIGTERSALPFPFPTPLANNFDPNSLFSAVPMTGNSDFRDWNQDTHSLGMPGLK